MALVTSHKTLCDDSEGAPPSTESSRPDRPTAPQSSSSAEDVKDPDFQRAKNLMDLHYGVKEKHAHGPDAGLEKARRDVETVIQDMKRGAGRKKG